MNEKILIVDDEPFVHDVLGGHLERDGRIVYAAWVGVEALRLVEA